MLNGTIGKLELQGDVIEVTLSLYPPTPTYLTPQDGGYEEARHAYVMRQAEYDSLHLGGCQLQQEKGK